MIESNTQTGRHTKAPISILPKRAGQSSLRAYLIQGASWSFALKIASSGIAFITTIILTRTLGAKGYGIYAYAMALVGLLTIPASLGLPQLVLRNVAIYHARAEWGLMRGLLRRANQVVILTSVGLGTVAALISWMFADHFNHNILVAFWIALSILPLSALNSLRASALRGLRYVVLGQLPDLLIKPLSFLALIVVNYLLLGDFFNASWAIGIQVGASGIALSFGILMLLRYLPKTIKETPPVYDDRAWARSALPFLFIGGMQIINHQMDIVMLGGFMGAETVAIYRVAARVAELIVLVLSAANIVLQPTIAKLYAVNDMQRLQRVATQSARVVFLITLPIAILLIVFSQRILLIFGEKFTEGSTALTILICGQLVNATIGSVGNLLGMTEHERDIAKGVAIAAVVNVTLNAILIPLWGIEGAATATATSLLVWNLILLVQVVKKIGIYPTALGRIGLMRRI